jgi:hypothetical protein
VLQDFVAVDTGEDLYNTYLDPPPATTSTVVATAPTPTSTPTPRYLVPVLRQGSNLIGGYYLDAAGHEDIAVLSVPSNVGEGGGCCVGWGSSVVGNVGLGKRKIGAVGREGKRGLEAAQVRELEDSLCCLRI